MRNLMKINQGISEKDTFKDFMILNMKITQE